MAEQALRIKVRVQPGASRNEVVGWEDGVLRVRVSAPPAGGRANAAVCSMLADRLGIANGRLWVERGLRGRQKTLVVEGMVEEEVRARLGG